MRRVILTVMVATTVAVAPAALAQEPLPLPFTIDTARLAADSHTVVVAGTYTCPELNLDVDDGGGGGTIDLTVNQDGVAGFGYVHIQGRVCDGTTRTWETDVTTFGERRFQRGPAQALASGLVTGEDAAGNKVTLQVAILSPGQPITITRR